jgi:hypothetical protein
VSQAEDFAMKVLLLQPPVDHYVPQAFRTEGLGVAYIASTLRRDGHEVELLDAHCTCLDLKQTIREVLSRDFQALGITCADDHRKAVLAIVAAVRKTPRKMSSSAPEATCPHCRTSSFSRPARA